MIQAEIKTNAEHAISACIYQTGKKAVLIIASATGVKQGYYQKFADFISSTGISVITFDYSGIGQSLNRPIKQIKSNAADWGKHDLETIIRYAKENYPGAKITLLGHSIGGQLIGLAPSAPSVQKIILVAAQSGYWNLWKGFDKFKMWVYWYLLFPALLTLFGYLPSKRMLKMEDLPYYVARQWSRWGRKPNYLFEEVPEEEQFFKAITVQATAISIENDFFAPKKAVDFLTEKYENAILKKLHLIPADYGTKDIGHFGVFRERFSQNLWKLLLDEIES